MKKTYYPVIVLSDLHLGTSSSKAKEVVHFLKHHKCDQLILNGDIIDGWQLRKSGTWKKQHSKFLKLVLKRASKGCEVVYLRGNHDDFLDEVIPFQLGRFSIRRDYKLETPAGRYYVVHGDLFDTVTTKLKWIAKLGDVGYTFLLWLNRHYNAYRERKGLPYYSLSQAVKAKVKGAVNFISDFETQLSEVARSRNCRGIICGHIHSPANKFINDIHYLNSGDWVESMTALVLTTDNTWEIIHYADWIKQFSEIRNASVHEDVPDEQDPEAAQLLAAMRVKLSAQ